MRGVPLQPRYPGGGRERLKRGAEMNYCMDSKLVLLFTQNVVFCISKGKLTSNESCAKDTQNCSHDL